MGHAAKILEVPSENKTYAQGPSSQMMEFSTFQTQSSERFWYLVPYSSLGNWTLRVVHVI